jgi:hypothetical protein
LSGTLSTKENELNVADSLTETIADCILHSDTTEGIIQVPIY